MSIGKGRWFGQQPQDDGPCDHGNTSAREHTNADGTTEIIVYCTRAGCGMEWKHGK